MIFAIDFSVAPVNFRNALIRMRAYSRTQSTANVFRGSLKFEGEKVICIKLSRRNSRVAQSADLILVSQLSIIENKSNKN